jgi:hypothetical protein
MLTKKHFKELAKIHAKALIAMNNDEPKEAYSIFEFGLRDFYKKINVNFNDIKFEEFTVKLTKPKPVKVKKLNGFDLIDHLERQSLLDAEMNG